MLRVYPEAPAVAVRPGEVVHAEMRPPRVGVLRREAGDEGGVRRLHPVAPRHALDEDDARHSLILGGVYVVALSVAASPEIYRSVEGLDQH